MTDIEINDSCSGTNNTLLATYFLLHVDIAQQNLAISVIT